MCVLLEGTSHIDSLASIRADRQEFAQAGEPPHPTTSCVGLLTATRKTTDIKEDHTQGRQNAAQETGWDRPFFPCVVGIHNNTSASSILILRRRKGNQQMTRKIRKLI